jgi:hypothetical protein
MATLALGVPVADAAKGNGFKRQKPVVVDELAGIALEKTRTLRIDCFVPETGPS